MRPYFQNDRATIYHGDCLEVMQNLEAVDAVVTDPPYASGARTEAKKASSGAMVRGQRWANNPIENDQMTTTGFVWLLREVARTAFSLLPEGGSLLSFTDWRQWPNLVGAVESVNFRINGMIVWDKGSMGLGAGFRLQHELVLHASRGVPSIQNRATPNILAHKRVKSDKHPSPKPVPLLVDLLTVVLPLGGVVLDPFMGAGSTLLGAIALGGRAIGIESVEEHCETAASLLELGPPTPPPLPRRIA